MCLAVFTREDVSIIYYNFWKGSVDAFDEVMIAMQPVVENFSVKKDTFLDGSHIPGGVIGGAESLLRHESHPADNAW